MSMASLSLLATLPSKIFTISIFLFPNLSLHFSICNCNFLPSKTVNQFLVEICMYDYSSGVSRTLIVYQSAAWNFSNVLTVPRPPQEVWNSSNKFPPPCTYIYVYTCDPFFFLQKHFFEKSDLNVPPGVPIIGEYCSPQKHLDLWKVWPRSPHNRWLFLAPRERNVALTATRKNFVAVN